MANSQQDLQLLIDALQTRSESEGDGVKYIYMDESTVYRFENNRMKKVSAALIKKANKFIQNESTNIEANENITTAKQAKQLKLTKQRKQPVVNVAEDTDDAREDTDDEEQPIAPVAKPKRTRQPKQTQQTVAAPVDLNEYWQVRNKNEFMQQELDRLNNKVTKLKHYKNIVNKLTGAEYDVDMAPIQQPQQQQQQPQQQSQQERNRYNNSLFLFD